MSEFEFDFLPLQQTVRIRDKDIPIRGIDLADVGQLIYRFWGERASLYDGKTFNLSGVAKLSKTALGAICAAAIGKLGDARTETAFANLSAGEMALLIPPIWKLTAPEGFGPFVAMLVDLGLVPAELAADIKKIQQIWAGLPGPANSPVSSETSSMSS